MNAETGRTYELAKELVPDDVGIGQLLNDYKEAFGEKVIERMENGEATKDETLAAVHMERGDPIVRVSEEVVQRLRLGDRELRRRKQRRR